MPTPSRVPDRARRLLVAASTLAVVGCAELLGLEDPAGRLDEDSTAAGAGTGMGGAAGTGGAAASSGGGAPATTSTGSGGGGSGPGVVALPGGFAIVALGAAPAGATMLVEKRADADAAVCGATPPAGSVAALDVVGSGCALIASVSHAGGSNLTGHSVERTLSSLAIAGMGPAGALSLSGASPGSSSAPLHASGAGFFGWLDVGNGEMAIVGTTAAVESGRALPHGDSTLDVMFGSLELGFTSGEGEECAAGPEGGVEVQFATFANATCVTQRGPFEGDLLDAARGGASWALLRGPTGECAAAAIAPGGADRPLGTCSGATGHLFVSQEDVADLVFAGLLDACDGAQVKAALVEARASAGPIVRWCDTGTDDVTRVIPFHVDATDVHFIRATETGADIRKAAREGGAESHDPTAVCTSCLIRDAVASAGSLYVAGQATSETEVFGQVVAAGRHFWAWRPLDGL